MTQGRLGQAAAQGRPQPAIANGEMESRCTLGDRQAVRGCATKADLVSLGGYTRSPFAVTGLHADRGKFAASTTRRVAAAWPPGRRVSRLAWSFLTRSAGAPIGAPEGAATRETPPKPPVVHGFAEMLVSRRE